MRPLTSSGTLLLLALLVSTLLFLLAEAAEEACPDSAHSHSVSRGCSLGEDELPEQHTLRQISPSVREFGHFLRKSREEKAGFSFPSNQPRLQFSENGTFKFCIFTDLHFGEGENTWWGPMQDYNSTRAMEKYLEYETPDFVVFNGDQITGNNIINNATTYWNELLQPVIAEQVPWGIIFGNHDDLSSGPGETRADLMAFDETYELSLSQAGPTNIHGVSNYNIPIYESDDSDRPAAVLYFFDSGGGDEQPAYIFPDQVNYYLEQSEDYEKRYNFTIPAMAFFHIPLPEYMDAWNEETCYGYKNESVMCQDAENGLLKAFWSRGDVRATYCGHNHENDYCCSVQGVDLCYGRHSGYGGYGPHSVDFTGTRCVELQLTEDESVWSYTSWIRLQNGDIVAAPEHTPCQGDGCNQQTECREN